MSRSCFPRWCVWVFLLGIAVCSIHVRADTVDVMDTADRFFGGTESMRIEVLDQGVRLRSVGDTDAFIRWATLGGGFIPLGDATDVLEVEIDDLGKNGRVQIRLEFADGDGNLLGNRLWFKRLRKTGLVALPSVSAFAASEGLADAKQFRVFFRLPRNRSMSLGGIRALAEPTPAAQSYLARLALRQLTVSIESRYPVPLVDTRETPEPPDLVIRNTGSEAMRVALELAATSFLGQQAEITHPDELLLEPNEVFRTPAPLGNGSNDAWTLRYQFTDGDAVHIAETHYAAMPFNEVRPQPVGGFHYAIAGSRFHRPAVDIEKTVFAHRVLGVTHTRGDLTWSEIQPGPDKWEWREFDRAIGLYTEAGIEPQLLLGYSARWAAPENTRDATDPTVWMFAPPDLDAWTRFVGTAARRYADQVTFWEVWNEPDLTNFWKGTTEQYIDLLEASYAQIHQNDPDAKVMTGGFATLMPHGGRKHFYLMRDVLRDAPDAFDVVAFHQHGAFDRFAEIVDHDLQEVLAVMPEAKPVYFNETAVGRGQGYDYQAESLVKKIAFTRSRGAIGHTWFTLVSGETFPWGVMLRDHEPLPAYVAYNALIRELGQLSFVRSLDLGVGNYGLLFGDAKRSLLIAWSQSEEAPRGLTTLRLREGQDGARRLDLMGNAHPAEGLGNRVVVPLGPRPSYLRIPAPASTVQIDRTVVALNRPAVLYGHEPASVMAELFNPFDETIRVILNPTAGSVDRQGVATTYVLEPGAAKQVPLSLRVPEGVALRYGDRFEQKVGLTIEPMGLSRQLSLPGRAGAWIAPCDDGSERPADFEIRDRPQVRDLFAFDPQSSDKVWAGPSDLSVSAWIEADDERLILQVQVRDDTHQPTGPWGDALAVALSSATGEMVRVTLRDDVEAERRVFTNDSPAVSEAEISRQPDGRTHYRLALNRASLGLDDAALRAGIGLNFAAYDADLGVRESWAELAPGMGETDTAEEPQTVRVRFAWP